MTTIREHAEQYLAMRRALGFKLTTFGGRLFGFVTYLETHQLNVITTEAALAWATGTPRSSDEVTWSRRLMIARIFARHMAVLDPATEIPPADVLPHHYRRVTPHLYTDAELAALLSAADDLRPPLRALTWRTLLGLLAVTGLRTGEACRLDDADIEPDDTLALAVRDSKFGKHRQVPIHPSTAAALRDYQRAPPVSTTRRPATLSNPLASSRLRTSSKVSSMRGAMIPTSSDLGTWLTCPSSSSPICGTAIISRSSVLAEMALPNSVFMRSAWAIGVESPRAISLVTCPRRPGRNRQKSDCRRRTPRSSWSRRPCR